MTSIEAMKRSVFTTNYSPHSLLSSLMDRKQAAAYLGMSQNHLTRLCCQGAGPKRYRSNMHGSKYFYKPTDLDAWKAGR